MLEFLPAAQPALAKTVVVVDNHDSFTFNLVQNLATAGARCLVYRNDEVTVSDLLSVPCSGILLSPGPGRPEQAGVTLDLVRQAPTSLPLLGVCLGHQALALVFGGQVSRASRAVHGKLVAVEHGGQGLFAGLPSPLWQARYNSLTVDLVTVPASLRVIASAHGEVMALQHHERPLYGLQFHPESILSQGGSQLLSNWLESLP